MTDERKRDPTRCNVVFPDGYKAIGHVTGLKLDWPYLSIKVHGAHLSAEISSDLAQSIMDGKVNTVRL